MGKLAGAGRDGAVPAVRLPGGGRAFGVHLAGVRRAASRRPRFRAGVEGGLFGVPLLLCSCGVIPVAASVRRHGASRAAATSFLLSTPQTGIDSIAITYALLGPVFAVFRPIVALVTGLLGGLLVMLLGEAEHNGPRRPAARRTAPKPAAPIAASETSCGAAWSMVSSTLPRDIGAALLVGVVIAGVIGAVVPRDGWGALPGRRHPFDRGHDAASGVPLYVCASASVPIAAGLIHAGRVAGGGAGLSDFRARPAMRPRSRPSGNCWAADRAAVPAGRRHQRRRRGPAARLADAGDARRRAALGRSRPSDHAVRLARAGVGRPAVGGHRLFLPDASAARTVSGRNRPGRFGRSSLTVRASGIRYQRHDVRALRCRRHPGAQGMSRRGVGPGGPVDGPGGCRGRTRKRGRTRRRGAAIGVSCRESCLIGWAGTVSHGGAITEPQSCPAGRGSRARRRWLARARFLPASRGRRRQCRPSPRRLRRA